MSTWHYQLMKHVESSGEEWYGVHEYYPDSEADAGYTLYPVRMLGNDPEDVVSSLRMMLDDIERYGIKNFK